MAHVPQIKTTTDNETNYIKVLIGLILHLSWRSVSQAMMLSIEDSVGIDQILVNEKSGLLHINSSKRNISISDNIISRFERYR